MIVSTKITGDFTMIPNALLNSKFIDNTAKIIYVYIRSKGERWNVFNGNLAESIGVSINTLKRYIQQLIDAGWLTRQPRRNHKNGKLLGGYDYTLHNTPDSSKSIKSVDNSDEKQSKNNSLAQDQPDGQELTPNTKSIENNIEKTTNVKSFGIVVDKYSEFELRAAQEYILSKQGVRNIDAYTQSVLKNNWHLSFLNKRINVERLQRYKVFDLKVGDQIYLNLVKQIRASCLINEVIAQQIINPSKVIIGNPKKCLAPNYIGFLYWLYLDNYSFCKFNSDEPEHVYIQFFNQLNVDKVQIK